MTMHGLLTSKNDGVTEYYYGIYRLQISHTGAWLSDTDNTFETGYWNLVNIQEWSECEPLPSATVFGKNYSSCLTN